MKLMAKKIPQAAISPTVALIIAFGLLIATLLFFSPYLGIICISALVAYLLFPIFRFFEKFMPTLLASWLVVLLSFLMIIVPVVYIGVITVQQGFQIANQLSQLSSENVEKIQNLTTQVSSAVDTIGVTVNPSGEFSLTEFIKNTIPTVVQVSLKTVMSIALSAPVIVTSTIIYGFLLSSFLRYHRQIRQFILDISPFDPKVTELYLKQSGIIVSASMRGQFVIALVTAISSAFLLFFLGMQPYFWFLVILFTFLGMIPFGSGIVVIPICLISMVLGDFWTSFWVLMFYLLVICNFDSFLRPKLIPKEAEIVPVLAVLATFSGLYFFGLLGVVYGPLVVIILVTTANVLIQYKKDTLEAAS